MRAREPDESGTVLRDGVEVAWEAFGTGPPTILLLPTWSVMPSRSWKAQVPFLARHARVVTFDGRGSGRSGRPVGRAAYRDAEFVGDAWAVLDATGTGEAALVGFSRGATWALVMAVEHPERVLGVVTIAPAVRPVAAHAERLRHPFLEPPASTEGWGKFTRSYWLDGDYDDFLRFFFAQVYPEPHSTKQVEDAIAWGHEIGPERLVDTEEARAVCPPPESLLDLTAVRAPVLVVHGDEDAVRPHAEGRALARATGGRLVTVRGAGHAPHIRHPVPLNHLLRDFTARVDAPAPARAGGPAGRAADRTAVERWPPAALVTATSRPRRALVLSSPIGLGHARRDLAVVRALRSHHPGLAVDWLAQEPVASVLRDAGERVHPASAWLASESAHMESEAGEHHLDAFAAIRAMDEILVANYMLFDDVVSEEHHDLVVADEAWDVDYFLHENPARKRFAFAWLTDFVGWLPMPEGGARQAELTADLNAEMIEHRARHRWLRDRSIFVGDPEDVVTDAFGPGLPGIREWTEANFDFAGFVTGFEPLAPAARSRLRARWGCGPDDPLCVVTVGGSGVGGDLLHRALDAVPVARRAVPGLRFLVVTGPRIDPASLPRRRGAKVVGYLPDLYRHLGAADVALVQGGLTTCMELTAQRVPFVYVPLRGHFEQNRHVRHRLERYGAGRCLPYEQACDPEVLAAALGTELGTRATWAPVETGGAARAAAMLAELV
ncbi:MAG TPA: alpha/beta fold hydrolase [Dermatophilaceae bacterium]|nr:alpha/beta fold hydrolase [Dermatophilaceae bacterium]